METTAHRSYRDDQPNVAIHHRMRIFRIVRNNDVVEGKNVMDGNQTSTEKSPLTRYPMVKPIVDETDYSPRLAPQTATQALQMILSRPAPVPNRGAETVGRGRLEGDSSKTTPIQRAIASALRSVKYLVLCIILGMVAYVAIPSLHGAIVTGLTIIAMAIVMLIFDALEYRHSQPGVERLRSQLDHDLEVVHEDNRHAETMTAIKGDIEIKLNVLQLAQSHSRLADKGGK
jgi:hypothetical protein